MKSIEQSPLELLDALSQLSRLRPEWRLGQTVANLAMTAGRLDAGGVWDLDDSEALSAARMLIEQYSEVHSEIPESGAPPQRPRSATSAPRDGAAGAPGR